MLRLSWIEIFLRFIPEMLIVIWGINVVCKQTINLKKYMVSSMIMGFLIFIVRSLPIYFGVHTFIIVILTICIVIISGIPIMKSIYSTLLIYFLLSLSEFINIFILDLFNVDLDFKNYFSKEVLGIPSLIILCAMIKLICCYVRKRKIIDI